MRIAIGCDDSGFPLKESLVAALEAEGHDVLDLGTFSPDPVDYPDYARAVGQAVLRGFVDASLLLCSSGSGGALGHSRTWAQIITDALGVPIALGSDAEASARGAALLALEALGTSPPAPPAPARVLQPDPGRHARYRAARTRQLRLYDNIVGFRDS